MDFRRAGLVLLLVAAGLLIGHTVAHIGRVRHSEEAIRPWMPVPYIARSRHVSEPELYRAIHEHPRLHDRRPLDRIARQQKRPVADLIHEIEGAVAAHRHSVEGPR